MDYTLFFQLVFFVNVSIPVCVFFSIKFGTYAIYAGKRMILTDNERAGNGRSSRS